MDLAAEEMGSCRDILLALLDFLVDPLLPSRSTMRETISLSQHELVAKQVHAVVLLYNYYHRKQNPGMAFLEFQTFCELAMDLKPSFQLYFKVTRKTDYSELEELDKDHSLTEEAILSACDTSKSLDASNNNPIIDDWPIAKVAVFLVDYRKENCVLFHGSITQGVWSVIEKEVNVANQGSEASMEATSANKKKRVMKRTDLTGLQELAYLAVKETCGINQTDLKILDNHSVYSTSKPKTTVRLYIMQCMQTNQDLNLVPINDVMNSVRGSLVENESVTPVVEYYHLLPFTDKVLDWFKREMSQESSPGFEATKEDGNCNSSPSRMEQTPKPSYHFEAVKNMHSSSHSQEEPLPNISEQNLMELNHSISEFLEATEEVINDNSCHFKEISVAIAPKNCEASEARNGNNHHLKEESVAVPPKRCEASEATNGNNHHLKEESVAVPPKHCEASEATNGNSQHLKGESFSLALQPSEEQAECQNARSFYLNENSPPSDSQLPESEEGVQNLSIYRRKEHPTEPVVYKKRNRSQKNSTPYKIAFTKTTNAPGDYPRQEVEQGGATGSSNSMDSNGKRNIHPCEDTVHDQKLMLSALETDQAALAGRILTLAEFPDACSNDRDNEKALSNYHIIDTAMSDDAGKQDGALVPFGSDFEHLHKMQLTITSKDPLVSKTALNVLLRKREQLSQQLRKIADEIALCEGNIQTILRGGEDNLAVKIETLVDGCNEISLQTSGGAGENTTLHYNYQELSSVVKRKRLSEANLSVLSPCRELDGICSTNFWMLPTYILSPLEGGFQATVNAKGADFDCSSEGTTCTTPQEARDSAASKILAKLRSLAATS